MPSLLDEIMPHCEFRERHRIWVAAEPAVAYAAVRAVTPQEIRLFVPLMAIRQFPSRLRGSTAQFTSAPLIEHFVGEGFAVLAEQPGREIVLGAIGRFWRVTSNEPLKSVNTAESFVAFHQPGYAKAAVNMLVIPDGDGSRIETETRVVATDGPARARFRCYWTVIRVPSGAIRRSWLKAIRRQVERRPHRDVR